MSKAVKKQINDDLKENIESPVGIENFFRIKIFSRLAIYSTLIGFVYNYCYFNIFLGIDVFGRFNASDLISSWFINTQLFANILLFFFIYLFVFFARRFSVKIFWLIGSISIILIFMSTLYYICIKEFPINIIFIALLILAFLGCISYTGIRRPDDLKNVNIISIELICMFFIILFTISYAFGEINKLYNNPKKVKIVSKSDSANALYFNEEYYYIGNTNSIIIASKDKPSEQNKKYKIFYIDDLSSIDIY